ncbi:glycosyltransferase family 4 protein [Mucilaginibacter angelicae]|uniref:Glycosyltransferase family 4 protein n=1 Tax=Mucilaginibacter angelicae TaxID=869718 RepID=A0ABV6L237_9SPHI
MIYVSVTYDYSPGFDKAENWFHRTRAYTGILQCLGEAETVISIKEIDVEGTITHRNVQHEFVSFGKKKSWFPFKRNRFIKSLNPDVVLLQGLLYPLQFLQLRLLLNRRVRIIAQHHAEKPFNGIKKWVQRLADHYIDAYLFASHALGMTWVTNGNISSAQKLHEVMEVSSIFYPVDRLLAQAKTGAKGQPVFLWVGRLNANKDPLNVVKAFLKFIQIQPGAKLYMIYHTDELLEEIKALLKDHHQKEAIILVGQVPHDDLLYWYNSADFIVSGSHYEGSGTAICEAMSCGCIPVVTDIASFRMITDNGNCGILYEAGNETAMLAALIAGMQLNRQEKRVLCLNYFKTNLSFEAIAGRIRTVAASL